MTSTDSDVSTYVEMFLRTAATGVTDWVVCPAPRMADDVWVSDGSQSLNAEPGTPNRTRFVLPNTTGDFNEQNPMGAYYGSIGLGVQTRLGVLSVDDQFSRTTSNGWGSVGDSAGNTWTNGSSSGGTVANSDWSVSGGTARHSVPADSAYRWSELSKTTRLYRNVEVRLTIKVPTTNVTGTGALASEVWMRTVDVNNNIVVSLAFLTDETLSIALADKISGSSKYLLNYTALSGLTLGGTGVDYELRCQVESGTIRAKVWQVGTPEPVGWTVYASGATIRSGYVGVASFVFTGNTNTKPLVFQYSQIQVRIPMFCGALTKLNPTGDGKSEPKVCEVEAAGQMERLQSNAAPVESSLRRSRSRRRRWLRGGNLVATAGTVRTVTVLASTIGTAVVGDFFFINDVFGGKRKEDTQFTITAMALVGSDIVISFTPDANESVAVNNALVMYKGLTSSSMPVVYWPCEDGEQATQISSGLPGGSPMSISGAPTFAAESSVLSSKPFLAFKDAELYGFVPDYSTGLGYASINFLLSMPSSDEAATNQDLLQFYTTGTGWSWDLKYTANGGGSFQLLVLNSTGTTLFDSGQIDFGLRGTPCMVTLVLYDAGAGTVTYSLYTIKNKSFAAGGVGPSTVTGVTTLGKVTAFRMNPGGGYQDTAMGHLTFVPDNWGYQEVVLEFQAWASQNALNRYMRLAFEDNVPISYRVDWDIVTTQLGAQKVDRLINLLKQPAASDGGLIHGTRGAYALEYIGRGALTNQAVVASFSANDCKELKLNTDFTYTENRILATRIDGTTAIAEKDSGPLSTQDAPNGIGLREQGYNLSLNSDVQAQDQAYYRLGLGTVKQPRVERLVVTCAGSSSISLETLLSLGVGDRIEITGLSSMDIYDTLPQLIIGVKHRLGMRKYPIVELLCVPYETFRAAALTADDYARPDTADTTIGGTLTTTQTGSISLVSASGFYLCSTEAADYPCNVMINGEEITLSGVTGDSSPQTGTISVRSVNGVVKTHASGESVTLPRPNYWQFK